ncbi:hypothetical protein B005_4301 [Nocardiopsis alba ATCC BAA-2165]|uniref:Uncharacterized protein n=1 Tax=Nocardiopsis alba (strain ATCC BAA-2165 / BE74) TaxID=1205910 RepID=J7L367_NOCAA|nr:hypothetical protein B005_4301 [Nocardiopsis alba ATCC BAA-2165]
MGSYVEREVFQADAGEMSPPGRSGDAEERSTARAEHR